MALRTGVSHIDPEDVDHVASEATAKHMAIYRFSTIGQIDRTGEQRIRVLGRFRPAQAVQAAARLRLRDVQRPAGASCCAYAPS
jgi:hypothetical protein